MVDNWSVVALMDNAAHGNQSAWNEIVLRYSPLLWSVCRRYRLSGADAEDIGGSVWLRLVGQLSTIREPAALPGWLATTTRRECLALLRNQNRQKPIAGQEIATSDDPALDVWLLAGERRSALREALATLADRDRQLLSLLFSDPPTPYTEISASLGMPIGAIGPTRQRCLARLRRSPAVAALLAGEHKASDVRRGPPRWSDRPADRWHDLPNAPHTHRAT